MTATAAPVAHETPSARPQPNAPQPNSPQPGASQPGACQPPFVPMPDIGELSREELEAFLARAIPADPL